MSTTKHLVQILQANYHGTDRATINRIVDIIKHLDAKIQALENQYGKETNEEAASG